MNHKNLILPLLAWFAHAARDLPWRRSRDPYAIWVSEIMLQQTQVKTVLPYYERWMRTLPDITSLAAAGAETIHKLWEGLGYYTRVRNLHRAAQIILREHAGRFPTAFTAVLALPGIGRYTAGAICSIAFNQPQPILDGNVIRVLCRWFGIEGDPKSKETNAKLWALAGDLAGEAASLSLRRMRRGRGANYPVSQFNQSLMELGALICTPRQPLCPQCPVASGCAARRQGRTHELPNLPRRATATSRRFVAFVACHRGRFLVRQRPAGVVNAHLWEFPNVEVGPNGFDLRRVARAAVGIRPAATAPLCVIKHSITRYRITLEAFHATGTFNPRTSARPNRWVNHRQLNKLPFTSAHRKIAVHLRKSELNPGRRKPRVDTNAHE